MMFAAAAGVFAGLFHVISGPDHLAAVAPLAVDRARPHWRAGLQWGLGHTSGVLLIGMLLLGFREFIPIALISAYSERIVGIILLCIGVWAALRARDLRSDAHAHGHAAGSGASFVMGTVHGVAGSSHLFGILPALALPTQWAAVSVPGGVRRWRYCRNDGVFRRGRRRVGSRRAPRRGRVPDDAVRVFALRLRRWWLLVD